MLLPPASCATEVLRQHFPWPRDSSVPSLSVIHHFLQRVPTTSCCHCLSLYSQSICSFSPAPSFAAGNYTQPSSQLLLSKSYYFSKTEIYTWSQYEWWDLYTNTFSALRNSLQPEVQSKGQMGPYSKWLEKQVRIQEKAKARNTWGCLQECYIIRSWQEPLGVLTASITLREERKTDLIQAHLESGTQVEKWVKARFSAAHPGKHSPVSPVAVCRGARRAWGQQLKTAHQLFEVDSDVVTKC